MKTIHRCILLGLFLLISLDITVAQNDVTFQVNMSIKMLEGSFRPGSGDIVTVRGEFNSWTTADTLTDLDGDSIYTKTISLLTGPFQYKFFKTLRGGIAWERDTNREYTVVGGPQIIPWVYFDYDSVYNPPVQYASFSATVLTGRDVLLEWATTQERNNYGFYVQRRDQIDTSFIDLPNSFVPGSETTNEPHYYFWTNLNVTPALYDYRLHSVDLDGYTTGYSSMISVQFLSIPSLNSPPNAATAVSVSPVLSWDTVSSAISYRLQVALDSLFTNLVFNDSTITMTSRQAGPLTHFTRYFWRVQAKNSGGTSAYSTPWNFTTIIGPPTNISANAGNHRITLQWSATGDSTVIRYRIYRDTSSPASTLIDSVSASESLFVNTGLTNGTTYYYRLTSVDSQLTESPFSNEVNAIPFNLGPIAASLRDSTISNAGRVLTNTITFSSSGSFDPDGQIDSIYWFVNNIIAGRDTILTHDFGPGTSRVMLIVQDDDGARGTSRATVTRSIFKIYVNGPVTAGLSLLGDSVLYAIAAGDAVYRLDIDGNTLYTLQVGGSVLSASSIAYDTTVYIASTDRNLYAFNRFGVPGWPALPLGGELSTTATIDSLTNRLYIGVQNRNFFAVNRTSGTVAWSYFSNAPIQNSAVVTTDRKLIFSTIRGTVYGFDLANLPNPPSPTWTLTLNDTITSSPAIDLQGFFYVGTKLGHLTKISMQQGGQASVVWQTQTGSSIYASPIIDGNGVLYVGSLDARFYAINTSNGSIIWQFQTSGPIRSTAALSSSRVIYIGNDAGQFYALDSLGSVKWWYQDSAVIRSPILYHQGTAYVGTEAGRILAFFDDQTLISNFKISVVTSPMWETFQGNNARTGVLRAQTDNLSTLPEKYSLLQNYPNPFNPTTIIRYEIPQQSYLTLKIYNVLGQEVSTLLNEMKQPGRYEVQLNAEGLASGMYFYRLQAGNFIETKKLVLLR